jgi:Kae1-associated kinase Bud32
MTEIGRGAEAVITKKDDVVLKERPKKSYRLSVIDEKLRKQRTKREAKILKALEKAGVLAPKLKSVSDKDMVIEMEFIDGKKVRDVIHHDKSLAKKIGKIVGQLHKEDVIHSDLTTSNMLVKNGDVHIIDFGLSYISSKVEDKAVDIHVMTQIFESSHHEIHEECIALVFDGYKEAYQDASKVLERLEVVQKRGRNKKK